MYVHSCGVSPALAKESGYVLKEKKDTSVKAENYCNHTDMFDDGAYWGIKYEVRVLRGSSKHAMTHNQGTKGDQWWNSSESIQIDAVWIQIRTLGQLPQGICSVFKIWDPRWECNPDRCEQMYNKECHSCSDLLSI